MLTWSGSPSSAPKRSRPIGTLVLFATHEVTHHWRAPRPGHAQKKNQGRRTTSEGRRTKDDDGDGDSDGDGDDGSADGSGAVLTGAQSGVWMLGLVHQPPWKDIIWMGTSIDLR